MTRGLQTTGMVLATALLASCLSEPDDGERLTGIDASAGELDQDERYDFDGYWSRFRDAVIGGDAAGVVALTHFPLSVRSVLDDAGERSVDRDDFLPLLSVLLEQDAGIEEQPRSLRDVISQWEHPPEDALEDAGETASIGPLEFDRTERGWRLVRVFLDQ